MEKSRKMDNSKKKIMLIDGNSIVSRAFYGIPLLTNKDNEYTNAIYGFMNIFIKLYDEEKPDLIGIAFDLPVKTFRHKLFQDYKGTRKPMPDELRPQIPALKNLLKTMNLKIFEVPGFEADDVLGTLSKMADSRGYHCVLVSGDKDMLQLATKNVQVKIPKTKGGKTITESYFEDDVIEAIGVTPTEFIDVKALMGDSSDNIPGVPSIGEKTAVKIISEYKTIENAIENVANLKPPRASKNLDEFREQAILSKTLAKIILDVPLEFNEEELAVTNDKIFNEEASKLVMRFSLKKLLTRFSFVVSKNSSDSSDNLSLNDIPEEFLEKTLPNFNVLSEKDDMKIFVDNILENNILSAYSITEIDEFFAITIVIGTTKHAIFHLDKSNVLEMTKPYFEGNSPKIALNSKKDMTYLQRQNITINNIVFDTVLSAYLSNSATSDYDYDYISAEFLEEINLSIEEIIGKGKNIKKSTEIDDKTLYNLSFNRADVIFRAKEFMESDLKDKDETKLYNEIELPLARVLSSMEIAGIKIDKSALELYGQNLKECIDILTNEIHNLAGEEFNLNSPAQLGVILFEKLGLGNGKAKKTKSKNIYSTASDVLDKLKNDHPIINKIVEYRTYAKLNSTYVDGLLGVADENSSKIHSTFNQSVTSTGRISSTEPNLQNIPIRLPLGREIRKIFTPTSSDYVFLDGDYSQIELRVLAHMANDPVLVDAFNKNEDIHRLTASHVFDTPFDEVTQTQRRNAKAVNFGIVYGISSFSLAEDLEISKKEADIYIKSYFNRYPKIKAYLDNSIIFAKENGYAKTIYGRRRYIPELHGNFMQRGFGERVAMNMPVQGTAADIIKIAMIKVYNRLLQEKLDAKIILQVHDELLIEAHKSVKDVASSIMKEEMENAVKLLVPLEVDVHEGDTWFSCK